MRPVAVLQNLSNFPVLLLQKFCLYFVLEMRALSCAPRAPAPSQRPVPVLAHPGGEEAFLHARPEPPWHLPLSSPPQGAAGHSPAASACSAQAFPCSTHLSPPFLQLFLQSLSGSFTAFPCGRTHSRTQVWGEARPQQVPFTHAAAYCRISPFLQAVHKTHFKFLQITICNAITNFIFHSNIM